MGASISKGYSQGKVKGKGKSMKKRTMKKGKGKSMKKRTMKKGKGRTMKRQRGGYVYSGTRQHRSTALARGVSLNKPNSHKKSKKNKSRK